MLCKFCKFRMWHRSVSKDIFKEFYELRGDRYFGDDRAMVGGIAMFGEQPVTVVGELRGKDMQESVQRNFGMPKPEGYRKAIRFLAGLEEA